jgi:hypothetical protein
MKLINVLELGGRVERGGGEAARLCGASDADHEGRERVRVDHRVECAFAKYVSTDLAEQERHFERDKLKG